MLPTLKSISGARILAGACLLFCLDSYAQSSAPLVDNAHTVAATTTAVPIEETFNIGTAGTYQISLADIGATLSPAAPLASVKLAISGPDNALVTLTAPQDGSSTVDSTKKQLIGAGTVTFSAQAGDYVIHVVGAPSLNADGSAVANSGPVSMRVTNAGGATQIAAFTDVLAFPPENSAKNNVGALSGRFTVATSGNYQITLTDMQLPAPLKSAILAVLPEGGIPLTDPAFGTTNGSPTATTTIALQSGTTYVIVAGGQANTDGGLPNAGLYGVNVTPAGGGAAVYSKTVPVGSVTSVGTPSLTPGNYTVSLTDVQFPAPLAQVGVVVAREGLPVAQLTSTTSSQFTAISATYEVYTAGVAAASSQGSYTLSLQPSAPGSASVLNLARAVSDPGSGVFAYSFDTTVVAETYTLSLADFGYPAAFANIQMGAVQAGVQLDKDSHLQFSSGTPSASEQLTPAAGPLTLIVFAQPPAASSAANSGGLFGVSLMANGAGAPAFETSQGVGQLFSVQKASITSGGKYQVVVQDLGFPATFGNLAVIVTRGTAKIGSIFGGGTLPFDAVGGDYLINFVAQPQPASTATPDLAGTYSMVVQVAPPAPTLTLQADPTTVASGGTVSLKWSTTNTSSCTGSSSPAGAWSGTVKTSDSLTTPALTATTTFTLTCTGTDGSTQTATQTVTVTSGSNSGGGGKSGGGGSIQADLLAALLGVLTVRLISVRRATRS